MELKIETERTWIRRFQETDWVDLFEYLSLPEIYQFEPGEPINETEAKQIAEERAGSRSFWAVERKEDCKMIGHLYVHPIEPKDYATWVLGYIFHPQVHNQGYCTEACKRMMSHVFDDLNAHRMVAYCNPLNPSSWRVLEKIGMKKEGHFRKSIFFRRDAHGYPLWHDSFVYAILREDR